MKEKLEFNLTRNMAIELIKFNDLKKELVNLKNRKVLDKKDLIQIDKLKNELNKTRISFIKEFRKNNQEEITKYLEIRDQFWSFFCYLKGFFYFLSNNIYEGKRYSSFVETV